MIELDIAYITSRFPTSREQASVIQVQRYVSIRDDELDDEWCNSFARIMIISQ
jgi:hypothetical protein